MITKRSEYKKIIEEITGSDDKKLILLYELVRQKLLRRNKQNLKFVSNNDEEKLLLIGPLPLLLLDKSYFPNKSLLVNFAEKKLKIIIPSWSNRSRDEILGRIISEIFEKNSVGPLELSNILTKMVNKKNKGEKNSFFLEWEKIIKENENI